MREVETRDNYILLEDGGRWAVVERRAGLYYSMRDARRDGADPADPAALRRIVGDDGWSGEMEARGVLGEVAERHDRLANRIW
jgi:hypothetical protein